MLVEAALDTSPDFLLAPATAAGVVVGVDVPISLAEEYSISEWSSVSGGSVEVV